MNYLKQDLTGKTVMVIKDHFEEKYHDDISEGFVCEGGFGCSPFTNGEKIFGHWVKTKESDQLSGRDVESIIEPKTTSPEIA